MMRQNPRAYQGEGWKEGGRKPLPENPYIDTDGYSYELTPTHPTYFQRYTAVLYSFSKKKINKYLIGILYFEMRSREN